jgi:hypothetical protein
MTTTIISFAGGLWDVRHDGVYVEDITLHDSTFDLMPFLSGSVLRRILAKLPQGVTILGFTCDPTTPLASRPMYGHGAAYRDGLD